VLLLEAEITKLVAQLEGMPIPRQAGDEDSLSQEQTQEESSLGVCRDLTGDTLESEGEEKVHSSRKLGGDSA